MINWKKIVGILFVTLLLNILAGCAAPGEREPDPARPAPEDNDTASIPRPVWAVDAGRDQHGHWADFQAGSVTQRMRWIPPGRFMMYSPVEDGDAPQQFEVTLTRGYWLAATECTQELWEAVMGSNPSSFRDDPRRPVERVSWRDCRQFMQRLNDQVSGLDARLPTEAEWEHAARAGTENILYGNLDDIAWHGANANRTTHPVAEKQPNAWGLYDMVGNVFEWCSDRGDRSPQQEDYPSGPVTDYTGPDAGSLHVIRGGGWYYLMRSSKPLFRHTFYDGYRRPYLGFRIAAPACDGVIDD